MYKRLIKFIDKNKILSKHQYRFRKNRSTEHALIELIDGITKAIDQGKYTIGIFLDLSKAFDTINHKILIKKLEHYGVRGISMKWFENYLSGRKHVFKCNQINSEQMEITSGVPQGSTLGPLLFLLYINDIQCSNIISVILFADDTSIFYSHNCLKTLNKIIQQELDRVSIWLNVNKLTINTTKTKFICFKTKKKRRNHRIEISINDQNIEQVNQTTFLGVIIRNMA
jgi:retron-type reverse transcriptase